jgi:DNA-directed RNA polymerase I, II, and III subunit RPABC1
MTLPRSRLGGVLIRDKALQEMQSEYTLEEFPESDLLVNITRHFLVPKPEEKSALIKK